MNEMVLLVISSLTMGQIVLMISVLATRAQITQAYWPLVGFFFALACLVMQPIVHQFYTEYEVYSLIIMLPALLLLAPLLWFYVEGMTSQTSWKMRAAKKRHLIYPAAGAAIAVATTFLPLQQLNILFTGNGSQMSTYMGFLMIVVFGLVIGWVFQSLFYLVAIVKRLAFYRKSLKQYFANLESRDMLWLSVFAVLMIIIWLAAIVSVLLDNVFGIDVFDRQSATPMAFLLVWCLGFCVIAQRPGFEQAFIDTSEPATDIAKQDKKYLRSALDQRHSQRIAEKLETLVESEQLYLDANISLSKLASMSGISAHYLSQTLNETLGKNFFDYINEKRIHHAKTQLQVSKKSVVDIAFDAGFNARSSFYKAFKQFNDQTPSQFRRDNCQES